MPFGWPALSVRRRRPSRKRSWRRAAGYHAGLLSLGALRNASVAELIEHARAVASVIPLFGFYLQPAVGGRVLPYEFWRKFVEIENVVAIKMAPVQPLSNPGRGARGGGIGARG